MILKSRAEVWRWEPNGNSNASWHFVTLDKKSAAVVKKGQESKKRIGWGSVPVVATVGQTSWKTSVRKKEGCAEGDRATISLQLQSRYPQLGAISSQCRVAI